MRRSVGEFKVQSLKQVAICWKVKCLIVEHKMGRVAGCLPNQVTEESYYHRLTPIRNTKVSGYKSKGHWCTIQVGF